MSSASPSDTGRRRVREATTDEVVKALGKDNDPATQGAVQQDGIYYLWAFDVAAIAQIVVQLPQELLAVGMQWPNQGVGKVCDQLDTWKLWLGQDHDEARRDRKIHETLLAAFEQGRELQAPPTLFGGVEAQVRDGKHRILAAYEFAVSAPKSFSVNVYWNWPG